MSAPTAADREHDFASDNHAGAHPDVLAAIAAASAGHTDAYGADEATERVEALFRRHFGADARSFLVFNGTAANVACLAATTREWEAAICAETAHLHVDECGAPERLATTKLLTLPAPDGKIKAADLARWSVRRGDEHSPQPRVVSITQSTELGTLYSVEETRAVADAAHAEGMLLHIDGARLANAAAALDAPLRALTTDAGADLLSFGGTKNGLAFGDAVVFLRPELADGFEFTRKQLGQLASKMRFLSTQFEALLGPGDLWLENASHANAMATRLAAALEPIDGVELAHPAEANGVFARLPQPAIDTLLADLPGVHPFHVWDSAERVVRWMCSWDTRPEHVDEFAATVASLV